MTQFPEDNRTMPASLEDVTPEWLSDALSCRYPDTQVLSLHVGSIIHGSSTKIRLLLTYNDAGHAHRLPPTLMMKTGFEENSNQVADSNRSEVIFYRLRDPDRLTNHAKCYFAGSNADSKRSVMLLEDLLARNVTFGFAARPTTPAIAQQMLDMLARYHARWWNSPELAQIGQLGGGAAIADDWIGLLMAPENFAVCMTLPRAAFVPAEWKDARLMGKALYSLRDINASGPPYTMLHGDMHLGNCFFEPDGEPGLLDWSGTTSGPAAIDLSEFLITALDISDRRAHDRDLMKYYLQQLCVYGVPEPPSFDDAWLSFRRNAAGGFMSAVCAPYMQPEAVISPYTERYMAAIADLDALESLDV
jgi:Phosphotransferase enzyme family